MLAGLLYAIPLGALLLALIDKFLLIVIMLLNARE